MIYQKIEQPYNTSTYYTFTMCAHLSNETNNNVETNDNIETTTKPIPTKRVRCEYDLLQQLIMNKRKEKVKIEIDLLKLTDKVVIFENQEIIASKVVSAFKSRKIINVMVISKTQSGKTGSMCATIEQYLEDSGNLIPIENI